MARTKAKTLSPLPKPLQRAIDRFPALVAKKKKMYDDRQKFLKDTFGDLVKSLNRQMKKNEKDRAG